MLLLIVLVGLAFCASVAAQENRIADCPKILVSCPDSISGSHSVFFAVNGVSMANVRYVWTVLAGTITQGQGTPTIRVAVRGDRGITATVEVIGLPTTCVNTASCSVI